MHPSEQLELFPLVPEFLEIDFSVQTGESGENPIRLRPFLWMTLLTFFASWCVSPNVVEAGLRLMELIP